jgi:hypothetical protein
MFVNLGGFTLLLSLLTIRSAFLYSLRYLSVDKGRDRFRLGQKHVELIGFSFAHLAPSHFWIDDTLYDCMI